MNRDANAVRPKDVITNTNEWITDRLPTEADADTGGYVWVSEDNGMVFHMMWDCVTGQPWMHFKRPKPYVKPQRFVIRDAKDICFNSELSGYVVYADVGGVHADNIPTREAAERIAAIYEEVMP